MATSSKRLFLAFAALAALAALASAPFAEGQIEQGAALPEGGGVLVPAATIQKSKAPASRSSDVRAPRPLVGEPVNGFPNWQERVIHEWINRARVDPQADLAGCPGTNCKDNTGGCYTPQPPLIWDANAGRSARYHSAEMGLQGYFAHDSACTVVSNINTIYPGSCGGSASCACVGGTRTCSSGPGCTAWYNRIGLFGASASGEIIAAGYSDSNSAFYAWLWEPADSTSCTFDEYNGHRYLILKWNSAVGTGYQSGGPYTWYYTGDFADSNSPIPRIPSGTHYPQQAGSIDFWANWHDSAPPQSAAVNVDGICHPMTLQRGSASNGAYAALAVAGLGSGCHRYFFTFHDSSGNEVTYPSSGSYGIGLTACNDWDLTRPLACTSSPPPVASSFYAVPPCRILDTRNPNGALGGPALQPNATRLVTVTSVCGIPASAVAISVNATTVSAGAGSFAFFPGNGVATGTTNLSFGAGQVRAGSSMLTLATDGTGGVNVLNSSPSANHLILDVNGYFQ